MFTSAARVDVPFNIQRTCRLCLRHRDHLKSVHENSAPDLPTIAVQLLSYVRIQTPTDDGMPTGVCRRCERAVYEAYTHKRMCEQSDATLRQYLQQLQCNGGLVNINDDDAIGIQVEAWTMEPCVADDRGTDANTTDIEHHSSYSDASDDVAAVASEQSVAKPQQTKPKSNARRRRTPKDLQYECDLCQRVYKSKTGIRQHMQQHVNPSPAQPTIACDECPMRFVSLSRLLFHKKKTHQFGSGATNGFQCAFCPKTFAQSEGRSRHMRQHVVKPLYTCDICQKTFHRKDHLSTHMNKHGGTAAPYQPKTSLCEQCGLSLSAAGMATHLLRHRGERPLRCPVCGKRFTQTSELRLHELSHTGERPVPCTLCDKRFCNLSMQRRHMRTHTGERPYACPHCERTFTQANSLKEHVRVHTGERPYACGICGERFRDLQTLKLHRQSRDHFETDGTPAPFASLSAQNPRRQSLRGPVAHPVLATSAGEPLLCPICDRRCVSQRLLTEHMYQHTGERPHKCPLCPQAFISAASLALHRRRHSGVKRFGCDLCAMRFHTQPELQKHRRRHTGERPAECTLCTLRFRTNGMLKRHMMTHTGERPFQCPFCQRAFAQLAAMRVHERTHTGERPYACGICGERFSVLAALKKHRTQYGHHETDGVEAPFASLSAQNPSRSLIASLVPVILTAESDDRLSDIAE